MEQVLSRGLLRHYSHHPGNHQPWQSVYPTTTAAGLASMAFAAPPAVHGALGYPVYVPEWDDRVNLLTGEDSKGKPVPEDILYPRMAPTIFQRLTENNIRSAVVSSATYRHSGFTRWLYAGATYVGYEISHPLTAIDAVTSCLDHGHRVVWVYWPYIDQTAHVAGPLSPATDLALITWDSAYREAMRQWRAHESVTLLVTADHGMVTLDPRQAISRDDPRVAPLWVHRWAGERRAITTEVEPDEVRALIGGMATVYDQQQLWSDGRYGGLPTHGSWRNRTLRTLIIPEVGVQFQQDGITDATTMKGGHGAFTDDERLVPLIIQTW